MHGGHITSRAQSVELVARATESVEIFQEGQVHVRDVALLIWHDLRDLCPECVDRWYQFLKPYWPEGCDRLDEEGRPCLVCIAREWLERNGYPDLEGEGDAIWRPENN